jgi:hypothetical protein
MKTTTTKIGATQPASIIRISNRRWISILVLALGVAFLLGTSGFQTYLSKERRLIAAGEEIVTALNAYRDASPGTAKTFPLELQDLIHDPRMLADKGYIVGLPIDPITLKQEWGVVRHNNNQITGVHSLSNESRTLFAKLFSLRGGDKYSEWKFVVR